MEDYEIVNLYWERKEKAIYETEKKYGHKIFYVIGNILTNRQDIEECVNDTYLGAWNSMPEARPYCLPAFILRIAKNMALKKYNYLTADKRNRNLETAMEELDGIISIKDIESEIIIKQTAAAVNKFLKGKKPLQRKIFIRRYYFYEPVNEIAVHFKLSNSAVKSVLFRIRKELKKYLESEGLL